ncbi:NAD(P)-dependent dehydrogenase, short-chain alcohol dehydrogenase family [Tistlia consotensis]|uniref:NAD(P)-dependent dehydrogenase, short-chain alcohol dehydrogenase family n=1 Tax=Tistlia consotensis USBA 355 TaxID=560819 RepID=A0A1Y6CH35_9PROT|nr:SDR family NAD(P)-dependent oxidoreductase [Tistlia consotensis]SMF62302.1 NAD(P)-dependent dehydrogenase, short-chain alcohol dehydrogenase family [Tistlia consotensis USBA 355]SNR94491.1 NAD(P)-dependent dehydrogenase, short-chain alcohol dehydrogenase family [Tistlia consotensis]
MDVKGLGAIVTGGGSGMGAAVGRTLAAAGAKVTLLDLNGEAAEAVAKEIGGLGLACDVSDAAAAEAAVARAREAHGPCRVLVNCAGIAPAKRIVGKEGPMPLEAFKKVIEVNLIGSFNLLRLAAADMTAAEPLNADGERGVIVSTASIAAFEGQVGQAAYSASKAGIIGMMTPAARELARFGVRVMTIAPGLIGTPLLLNMPQDVQDNLAQQTPFPKRFGTPQEFASLVMTIVGNPMMSNDTIRLDGGMRMQ